MLTFDQYKDYYEKWGKCVTQLTKPKQHLNEKQLKSSYNRYVKSEEKKILKRDRMLFNRQDTELRKNIFARDHYYCRLDKILFKDEYKLLKENAQHLHILLDPAHVFGKGAYPHMRFDEDNIVVLNRYSHSMLDTQKNPLTGEAISKEEKIKWWIRIVGKELYQELKKRTKEKN